MNVLFTSVWPCGLAGQSLKPFVSPWPFRVTLVQLRAPKVLVARQRFSFACREAREKNSDGGDFCTKGTHSRLPWSVSHWVRRDVTVYAGRTNAASLATQTWCSCDKQLKYHGFHIGDARSFFFDVGVKI